MGGIYMKKSIQEIMQAVLDAKESNDVAKLSEVLDKVISIAQDNETILDSTVEQQKKYEEQISNLQRVNNDFFVRLHGTNANQETHVDEKPQTTLDDVIKHLGGEI